MVLSGSHGMRGHGSHVLRHVLKPLLKAYGAHYICGHDHILQVPTDCLISMLVPHLYFWIIAFHYVPSASFVIIHSLLCFGQRLSWRFAHSTQNNFQVCHVRRSIDVVTNSSFLWFIIDARPHRVSQTFFLHHRYCYCGVRQRRGFMVVSTTPPSATHRVGGLTVTVVEATRGVVHSQLLLARAARWQCRRSLPNLYLFQFVFRIFSRQGNHINFYIQSVYIFSKVSWNINTICLFFFLPRF